MGRRSIYFSRYASAAAEYSRSVSLGLFSDLCASLNHRRRRASAGEEGTIPIQPGAQLKTRNNKNK